MILVLATCLSDRLVKSEDDETFSPFRLHPPLSLRLVLIAMGCFPYECRHCGPECWTSDAIVYPREVLWIAPGTTAPPIQGRCIPAYYDSYGRFEGADNRTPDGVYWLSIEAHTEIGTIPFDDLDGATCVVLVAVACRDCHDRVSAASKKRLAKKRKEFVAPVTPKQKRSLWMALATLMTSGPARGSKVAPASTT
jgi:hypothetical protein